MVGGWIIGILLSGTLASWVHRPYDCLCLMALFRAVMSSVHDWAEWSVQTVTGSGYYRTITWEGGYLPRLCPPCDVDRLCDYMAWQIKGPV